MVLNKHILFLFCISNRVVSGKNSHSSVVKGTKCWHSQRQFTLIPKCVSSVSRAPALHFQMYLNVFSSRITHHFYFEKIMVRYLVGVGYLFRGFSHFLRVIDNMKSKATSYFKWCFQGKWEESVYWVQLAEIWPTAQQNKSWENENNSIVRHENIINLISHRLRKWMVVFEWRRGENTSLEEKQLKKKERKKLRWVSAFCVLLQQLCFAGLYGMWSGIRSD